MYMQVCLPPKDYKFVRILFRFDEREQVRTFTFTRVAFGLKSSPYMAMRTVKQLCLDEGHQFPDAATVASSQLYMDDLVHSCINEETSMRLSQNLIALFKTGAFDLVKWSSNSQSLLDSLPDSHRACVNFDDKQSNAKVLGLSWEPSDDTFSMTTSPPAGGKCTKRIILSTVARLFDVLGLVAPVVLYAKLLIKELWLSKTDWDATPPEHIIKCYSMLVQEFPLLSTLKIPRHIGVSSECTVNIIGFSDASLNGYGCVIYLHVTDLAGNISVKLLCSKSKVSPAKITTLARLELCAAVLMSKLIKLVQDTYLARIPIAGIYAFSDSTIALSWIKA
jgi:hypothetical protein